MLHMSATRSLLTDIKFSHTIFALPFAFLGASIAGTMTVARNAVVDTFGMDNFTLMRQDAWFFARTLRHACKSNSRPRY